MQQKMIRHCPKCKTERPFTESFCENEFDGNLCDWPLLEEGLALPGTQDLVLPVHHEETLDVISVCVNGHAMPEGDLLCLICDSSATTTHADKFDNTTIDGWRLLKQLPSQSAYVERFLVERLENHDGKRYIAIIFGDAIQPDEAIYPILERFSFDDITPLRGHGFANGRHYQVWEEFSDRTLEDFISAGEAHKLDIKEFISKLGKTLNVLTQLGIRHRDLRPCNILVGSKETSRYQIGGFCSALFSQHDIIEILCPLDTTRYTAPEAIGGGITAASDWWALGAIILELTTNGKAFEGVNEKAFLIHVVTRGIEIPSDVSAEAAALLTGLLTRDTSKRWNWTQVQKWVRNEVEIPNRSTANETAGQPGPPLALNDERYFTPENFALAAADAQNWEEASVLLTRGTIATWLAAREIDEKTVAIIRSISLDNDLSDDLKLAFSLLLLNHNMPLSIRGEIVSPAWLLRNVALGYELITGSRVERLRQIGREPLLQLLGDRALNIRSRIETLDIEPDEDRLREALLATSRRNLETAWTRFRVMFPDSSHQGIEGLLQRRSPSEEDYIVLLSSPVEQFIPSSEILERAEAAAHRHGIKDFKPLRAQELLSISRNGLYELLDEIMEGFARCGIETLDMWADTYRMEHRITLERALVLLSLPRENWIKPAKQQYISNILGFFENKVLAKVNKGPLVKQSISRTSSAVDLTEISGSRKSAHQILDHLLERSGNTIEIDPAVLDDNPQLASRLSSLVKKTRIFTRDTGRHGLFLGFPYIVYQTVSSDGAKVSCKAAPLMLWPIKVQAGSSGRGRLKLASENQRDEVRLNPALEGILDSGSGQIDKWRRCAEEVLQRSSIRHKDILDVFAQIASVPNKDLVRLPGKDAVVPHEKRFVAGSAVLFNCDFSGKSIADDLRHMRERPLEGTALERALKIGSEVAKRRTTHTDSDASDTNAIIELDPSQSEAILKANGDIGLHIEGPPGTGKSQTIVNIIADSVARGQTVLVVCQKQAALSIVEKRLKAHGLGNRLFLINDAQKDREPVLKEFRAQREVKSNRHSNLTYLRNEHLKLVRRIQALETDINDHHNSTFAVDENVGWSYRNVLAELISIEASRHFVAVPELQGLLSLLSDANVGEIEDVCSGVARLWLESEFEHNILRVLKHFTWDASADLVFREQFDSYLSAEEVRKEVLEACANSPDLEDVESVRSWIEENEEYLGKLPDHVRKRMKLWLPLFPADHALETDGGGILRALTNLNNQIVELEKTGHSDSMFKVVVGQNQKFLNDWIDTGHLAVAVLDEENLSSRTKARWQILRFIQNKGVQIASRDDSDNVVIDTFSRFIDSESERQQILATYANCFDTTDGEALTNWLQHNQDYFADMEADARSNLSRWHRLFDSAGPRASEGVRIVEELKELTERLDSLDNGHHRDILFDSIHRLSEESLAGWEKVAKKAIVANSPFKNERDEKLSARWLIVRFLKDLKITELDHKADDSSGPLKEALGKFVQAEEDRIQCIRDHGDSFIIDNPQDLKNWLKPNEEFFKSLSDANRKHLSEWIVFFGAEAGSKNLGSQMIEELEELQYKLSNLNKSHHDERYFGPLGDLPTPVLVEWIATAKKATTLHALNPVTHVSRWRIRRFLSGLGAGNDDAAVTRFLKAGELEYELAPIRSRFFGLVKRLRLAALDLNAQNVHGLEQGVAEVLASLKCIKEASSRVYQCPTQLQAKTFVSAGTRAAFEQFLASAASAVQLHDARMVSLAALNGLSSWFDEAWITRYKEYIGTLHHDLLELRTIWDGVPLFNDATIECFANVISLESRLSPLRHALEQIAQKLQVKLLSSQYAKIGDTEKQTDELLKNISLVAEAASKLWLCPCSKEDQERITDVRREAFEEFVAQAAGAIQRHQARSKSHQALELLAPYFEDAWIVAAKQNVDSNIATLKELKALEPMLKAFSDSTFASFLSAVQLELAVSPLRIEFNLIAEKLQIDRQSLGNQTIAYIEEQAAKLQQELQLVSDSTKRINACPCLLAARDFAKGGTNSDYAKFSSYLNGAIRRNESRAASEQTLSKLDQWFEPEWIAKQRSQLKDNKTSLSALGAIKSAFPSLRAFQQFRFRAKALDPLTIKILSVFRRKHDDLVNVEPDELSQFMRSTIRREACLSWKGLMEQLAPALILESNELSQKIETLNQANEDLTKHNKRILCEPDWTNNISLEDDDWNAITRLRGQRMIRLREFVEQGNELGLLRIRPIWLMNPEVVSRLLPLQKGFFDKVIFDEASQLPVEYAIPALYRAKQAIVSGDEKQMPPSDFFTSKHDSGEDDDDESESEDYLTESQKTNLEEKWNRREIKDCPDLLTLAASILPSSKLEIHYRSEYRELIAFSNAAFYSGSLNIPCKHPEEEIRKAQPIEVVRANSIYRDQTNEGEAQKVIEVLKRLWSSTPRPSIGIVTFNLKQSELIEDLLGEEAERDPRFASIRQEEDLREEDGEDMGFFVKNLENVQGDERDVIVFSTTFGKNEMGVFKRFFGKVGQAGGERRLNVAITRAKRKVILVTSMPISEISDCIQSSRMPRSPREYLHCYLEYASRISDGNLDQANALLEKLNRDTSDTISQETVLDGFVRDVQTFVRDLGYEAISSSDDQSAFGLDLAVLDPKTGLFGIGIECDAPRHHLLRRAYHREVWRQSVLARSIKTVHRISSRHWYHDRQRQQKLLEKAIQDAMN